MREEHPFPNVRWKHFVKTAGQYFAIWFEFCAVNDSSSSGHRVMPTQIHLLFRLAVCLSCDADRWTVLERTSIGSDTRRVNS